jgi:predicted regulator of Ras-like GTPase activity (Roadblock/LC7/MglB family)
VSPDPALPLRPGAAPAPSAPLGGSAARARELRRLLAEMLKIDRVLGGLVVAADGLVITASLPRGVAADALAALAATLGRELEVGADRLKRTTFRTALFSADNGTVFLGSSAVGFVVLLGDREANLGLVQWALRKALATLEGTWGARDRVPATPEDI